MTSIKASYSKLLNINHSQIIGLQKLVEAKNRDRTFTLAQKITRQQNLGNLKETYKPLLANQTQQLTETQSTNVKLDEAKVTSANIVKNLAANGDLTNAASKAIVKKLDKLDKGVFAQILKSLKKEIRNYIIITNFK